MIGAVGLRIGETLRLWRQASHLVAGRRPWIVPLVTLLWIAFEVLAVLLGWWGEYSPADAQTLLIGMPLTVLGAGFGVRIIAGEIDQRTIEIAYTVPGGAHRVWLAKIAAAVILLLVSLTLLSVATWLFCTDFALGAVYGAFQAAIFYLVVAMALSVLFKSEATGALVTVVVGIVNGFLQGANVRASPFFNPANLDDSPARDVLAWTVQNRIGIALAIVAITALAFVRAERREKLLGG